MLVRRFDRIDTTPEGLEERSVVRGITSNSRGTVFHPRLHSPVLVQIRMELFVIRIFNNHLSRCKERLRHQVEDRVKVVNRLLLPIYFDAVGNQAIRLL